MAGEFGWSKDNVDLSLQLMHLYKHGKEVCMRRHDLQHTILDTGTKLGKSQVAELQGTCEDHCIRDSPRMSLRSSIVLVLSLTCVAAPTWADYSAGEEAYSRGDYATAFRELNPLAANGDARVEYLLGLMYVKGEGVPQDFKKAEYWWFLAAEQGHTQAQDNLGAMYTDGLGIPVDFKQAVRWYRSAAEQGEAKAQTNLGLLYAKGEGVPLDLKEAVQLFRLAAEQGEAKAQFNLGVMYAEGQGVPQDFKEAMEWYYLAAMQGDADAYHNLGVMYATGDETLNDNVLAEMWFTLAAAHGEKDAMDLRDRLATKLTPAQMEVSQKLVREWKPTDK